jgi:hypothetical protein
MIRKLRTALFRCVAGHTNVDFSVFLAPERSAGPDTCQQPLRNRSCCVRHHRSKSAYPSYPLWGGLLLPGRVMYKRAFDTSAPPSCPACGKRMKLARVLEQSGDMVNVFACDPCRLAYTSLQEVAQHEGDGATA